MSEKDFIKFLKLHDAIRINDFVIYSYTSAIEYECYGAFGAFEMDGEYYINENPSFSDRGERAKQRCIDFAITKTN